MRTSYRERAAAGRILRIAADDRQARCAEFVRIVAQRAQHRGFFSIMTTEAAPRESASKPSARCRKEVEARHAGQVLPEPVEDVSRTRSGVGLKSATSGEFEMRLRQRPPMTGRIGI